VTERPVRIADQGYLLARRSVRLKVMTKLVAPLLDTLAEIADDERDILLDTFRVWMENNGSVRTAGDLLFLPAQEGRLSAASDSGTHRCLPRP
jgi:hypothetical protein